MSNSFLNHTDYSVYILDHFSKGASLGNLYGQLRGSTCIGLLGYC